MAKKGETESFDPSRFRALAKKLLAVSRDYERLAEAMEDRDLASVDVENYASLTLALENLSKHTGKAMQAITGTEPVDKKSPTDEAAEAKTLAAKMRESAKKITEWKRKPS